MKMELIRKIINVGTLDTRDYRYMVKDHGDYFEIVRICKKLLGTTACLPGSGNWETVCTSK